MGSGVITDLSLSRLTKSECYCCLPKAGLQLFFVLQTLNRSTFFSLFFTNRRVKTDCKQVTRLVMLT